jgi:hypothetical protein
MSQSPDVTVTRFPERLVFQRGRTKTCEVTVRIKATSPGKGVLQSVGFF